MQSIEPMGARGRAASYAIACAVIGAALGGLHALALEARESDLARAIASAGHDSFTRVEVLAAVCYGALLGVFLAWIGALAVRARVSATRALLVGLVLVPVTWLLGDGQLGERMTPFGSALAVSLAATAIYVSVSRRYGVR
jgi:hypothetical protein